MLISTVTDLYIIGCGGSGVLISSNKVGKVYNRSVMVVGNDIDSRNGGGDICGRD